MGSCTRINFLFLFVVLSLATHPLLHPLYTVSDFRNPSRSRPAAFLLYAIHTWIANVFVRACVCVYKWDLFFRSSFLIYSLAFHKAMLNWTFAMVIDVFNVIGFVCLHACNVFVRFVYKNSSLLHRYNAVVQSTQYVTALNQKAYTHGRQRTTPTTLGWA